MANLIIKSSADNLVLQGSDASPALTVAADGQTTFAESATLSGTLGVTGNTTLSGTNSGSGFITHAQQFRLAANQAGSAAHATLTNFTEADNVYQRVGAIGWSHSSGVFSTTETGIYICFWSIIVKDATAGDAWDGNIQISTDSGSNYNIRSHGWSTVGSDLGTNDSVTNQFMFDVSNASTFRLIMKESNENSMATSTTILGATDRSWTNMLFLRIGNT